MSLNTNAMVELATTQPLTLTSCVDAVAVALPKGAKLYRAYVSFKLFDQSRLNRALQNPLASAGLVARLLKCKRVNPAKCSEAWGVTAGGTFALKKEGRWFARSSFGLMRIPANLIARAWEIK